jgi:peroxiredoxin
MTEKATQKHKTLTRRRRQPVPKRPASKARQFLASLIAAGHFVRHHIFITGGIATCLIVLAVWGLATVYTAPKLGYEVGDRAPDFNLQTIDGQNISSSNLRGNVALIGFWRPAEWNSTTDWEKMYLAEQLQKIKQIWANRQVVVLVIVPESDKEDARNLAAEEGATFPIAVDPSETTFASFGILHDPTQVFIDDKGTIRAILPGLFQNQYEIETVLSNIRNKQKIQTTRPGISDVQVTMVTDKRAEVSFATDKSAIGWLVIAKANANTGDASTPAATPHEEASATTHSITLANLQSETTYSFKAFASFDTDGKNPSLSREFTFTTLVDTSPPAISNVKIVDVTDYSLTITWATDKPATSHTEYPIDQWPNKIAASSDRFTVDHNITLKGLKSGTEYKITLKSKDAAGHESEFVLASVRTLAVPEGNKIGMRAPDFSLPTLDSATVKLSDFSGKIVMVNFWLTHCGACQTETQYFQAIYDKWPKDKLALLTITLREDPQTVRNFMNSRGLTFPVLLDSEGSADRLYQPILFPTTFFVDSRGIIKEIKEGLLHSPEEIEDILRSIQ